MLIKRGVTHYITGETMPLSYDPIKILKDYFENSTKNLPEQYRADTNRILSHRLKETWFSSTLAWLLNPKESHGFGVDFVKKFVRRAAQIRTDHPEKYRHLNCFLKFGKGGNGHSPNSFKLGNASMVEGLYLHKTPKSIKGRHCDVVSMDTDDRYFLVVENKLFSRNGIGQLYDVYTSTEYIYGDMFNVREYVYLTLNGSLPVSYLEETSRDGQIYENWICMSWTGDILPILWELCNSRQESGTMSGEAHREIEILIGILELFRSLEDTLDDGKKNVVKDIETMIAEAVRDRLLKELEKLSEERTGHWSKDGTNLKHSSFHAQKIAINYKALLEAKITGPLWGSNNDFNIIIPCYTYPDQTFARIYMEARNICYKYFGDNVTNYKNKKWAEIARSPEHEKLFEFVYKYNQKLCALMNYISTYR